jgi:pentachlorophenol monooxygenase
MDVYLIAAPTADVEGAMLPLLRDVDASFARVYAATNGSVFVLRPDGYLGWRHHMPDVAGLTAYLAGTFA